LQPHIALVSTDNIFCIQEIVEKKLTDFKKAHNSLRAVLFNICTESGILMKYATLMKMTK